MKRRREITEVWAQLLLSDQDCVRVNDLLVNSIGVRRPSLLRAMHLTVYYARRPTAGLSPILESTQVVIPAANLPLSHRPRMVRIPRV
jgi:hypothetical protein